jgi:DMSO/TMAO reductase YedYZ heme-binding membrane subunit
MSLTPSQEYVRAHKKPIGIALEVLAVAALLAPPLIVVLFPVKMQDTWTAIMRVSGFLAFTLIFMNLLTGPLSKWFYMVFNPKRVQKFHIATGASGFALAVMHGAIVFTMHHYRDHPATWLIGPIALGLMIVTASVAANRKKLPQLWRTIHQLNYLIFAGIYIKAMLIGTNITTNNAAGYALRAILSAEMLVVLIATVIRIATRVKVPARVAVEAEAE